MCHPLFTHLAGHCRPSTPLSPFVFARCQVKVEAAAQLVIFVMYSSKKTHFRVPDINVSTLLRSDAVNMPSPLQTGHSRLVFRSTDVALIADAVQVLFSP